MIDKKFMKENYPFIDDFKEMELIKSVRVELLEEMLKEVRSKLDDQYKTQEGGMTHRSSLNYLEDYLIEKLNFIKRINK